MYSISSNRNTTYLSIHTSICQEWIDWSILLQLPQSDWTSSFLLITVGSFQIIKSYLKIEGLLFFFKLKHCALQEVCLFTSKRASFNMTSIMCLSWREQALCNFLVGLRNLAVKKGRIVETWNIVCSMLCGGPPHFYDWWIVDYVLSFIPNDRSCIMTTPPAPL